MYMFDNIALFTQLVEMGSYTKTAEFIRVSPSTLTRKIQELESYLNVQLLQRDTRNISLTHEGEIVYLKFKDLRTGLSELFTIFNPETINNKGRLRVILPTNLPTKLINPYISYFTRINPNIKLSICYQLVKPDLSQNDFDIIITQHNMSDNNHDFRIIRTESVSLYCTTDYINRFGQPITIDELSEHNFMSAVDPSTNLDMDYLIFTNKYTNQKHYLDATNSNIKVNSAIHAKEIGMTGECIFGCWESLCEDDVRTGKLVHILPEYDSFSVNFYMITKKTLRPIEQAFIDFIYRCMNKSIASDVLNNPLQS